MLVRAQGEGIDLLSSQFVADEDILRRLDHLDVGVSRDEYGIRWPTGSGPHGVE
jgi:hypothetical protein